jgi:hypothetical protein
MLKISFVTWIANAAAALTGAYGDVTRQAEVADCSRQTIYDHAQKVQAAVVGAHDGEPTRAELIAQNQQLRHENAQLWLFFYSCASVFDVSPLLMDRESSRGGKHSATPHRFFPLNLRISAV